jgi:hypothetical protein
MLTINVKHRGAVGTIKIIVHGDSAKVVNHGTDKGERRRRRLAAKRAAPPRHEPEPLTPEGEHTRVTWRVAELRIRYLTSHNEDHERALAREAARAVSLAKRNTIQGLRSQLAPARTTPARGALLAGALVGLRQIEVPDARRKPSR